MGAGLAFIKGAAHNVVNQAVGAVKNNQTWGFTGGGGGSSYRSEKSLNRARQFP